MKVRYEINNPDLPLGVTEEDEFILSVHTDHLIVGGLFGGNACTTRRVGRRRRRSDAPPAGLVLDALFDNVEAAPAGSDSGV